MTNPRDTLIRTAATIKDWQESLRLEPHQTRAVTILELRGMLEIIDDIASAVFVLVEQRR